MLSVNIDQAADRLILHRYDFLEVVDSFFNVVLVEDLLLLQYLLAQDQRLDLLAVFLEQLAFQLVDGAVDHQAMVFEAGFFRPMLSVRIVLVFHQLSIRVARADTGVDVNARLILLSIQCRAHLVDLADGTLATYV